jgi:hypothetical protein
MDRKHRFVVEKNFNFGYANLTAYHFFGTSTEIRCRVHDVKKRQTFYEAPRVHCRTSQEPPMAPYFESKQIHSVRYD